MSHTAYYCDVPFYSEATFEKTHLQTRLVSTPSETEYHFQMSTLYGKITNNAQTIPRHLFWREKIISKRGMGKLGCCLIVL